MNRKLIAEVYRNKMFEKTLCIVFVIVALFMFSEFHKSVAAETDFSGTWFAVVNSAEGKWDYKLILKRQSSERWTGTLTFTLNGKDSTTTEAAVESLGSGKINLIWRPGTANAQSFEGTYTKDKITVAGFNGQLTFTR